VEAFDADPDAPGEHSIKYDDGSKAPEDLREMHWRLLDAEGRELPKPAPPPAHAGDAAAAGSSESSAAYSDAYSLSDFETFDREWLRSPDRPQFNGPSRVLSHPSIAPEMVRHLTVATGLTPAGERNNRNGAYIPTPLPSAKVRRLLADLAALGDDEEGVPLKAVVFSSHKWAVKHLDRALAGAGVSHVTIVKESTSTNRANVETAVARWNTDPNCRVFLLHAGAAAAGLTLVAARKVFLMEPFLSHGMELQALNRCHRIGQTRPVSCVTYYAARTIEERMLASRDEFNNAPELLAPPQQSSEGEAVSVLEGADASEASAEVLRFLLGMRDATEEEPAAAIDVDEDEDSDDDLPQPYAPQPEDLEPVAYYR